MALSKSIPTDRGVDATYWRATDFRLNTERPEAPYAVVTWVGYTSQQAYLDGKAPLADPRAVRIKPEDLVPILGQYATAFSDVALAIDTWAQGHLDWTTETVDNPDFDPEAPESDENRPRTERPVPGPWADAEMV